MRTARLDWDDIEWANGSLDKARQARSFPGSFGPTSGPRGFCGRSRYGPALRLPSDDCSPIFVIPKHLGTLQSSEPLAIEFTAALKQGEVDRLSRLSAADPELTPCLVENPKGDARSPLHLFADWPGHNLNAVAIVQTLVAAGADLDAPPVGMWHREASRHWAANKDDVTLIDALLDVGGDIEHEGSSIDGGPPLSCAVGYGQWAAARRLVERGARTLLWQEAALGLLPAIIQRVEADRPPRPEALSGPFWNACHGWQLVAAHLGGSWRRSQLGLPRGHGKRRSTSPSSRLAAWKGRDPWRSAPDSAVHRASA